MASHTPKGSLVDITYADSQASIHLGSGAIDESAPATPDGLPCIRVLWKSRREWARAMIVHQLTPSGVAEAAGAEPRP